jgi:hypothetical protein
MEEYIKGSKSGKLERTKQQEDKLDEIKMKLKDNYKWIEDKSVAELAGQNCSEMLVEIGKQPGKD